MRILLVADIHGNRAALEAVRETFDLCLFLGDAVDYGPEPAACIDWLKRVDCLGVRGNHDHGVAQNVTIQGAGGFRYLTGATRPAAVESLTPCQRRFLADLPTSRMLKLGGKRWLLVHATPRDPMDEYAAPDPAFWAARLQGLDVDFVCVGHTHVPYVLQVGRTTVVNPGSVGLSRDSDPRAAYAILDGDAISLKRVDYDVDQTIAAVDASNIDATAKRMLTEVYRGRATFAPHRSVAGNIPAPTQG